MAALYTIKYDFEEKRLEAEILINHIQDVSNETGSVNKVAILKSAFIILLYNVIESTAVLILERVHEKVSRHQYSELSEQLKSFMLNTICSMKVKKQQVVLNLIIGNSLTFPDFDELTKR